MSLPTLSLVPPSERVSGKSTVLEVSDIAVQSSRHGARRKPTIGASTGHTDCMRVVFATAELSPVAAVGGLAAAAAGLGSELRRLGVDVDLVMPDYGDIALTDQSEFELDVPAWVGAATVRRGRHPEVGALGLVSVPGMARPHPYLQPDGEGWPDNSERFFRFARAVAAYVEQDPPDVLHLNDWHTGAALAALTDPPPTVVSIHNLAYQGVSDAGWLDRIGPRAAHYEW